MGKIIIKFGELWLKSEPVKRRFLKILAENISRMLKGNGVKKFRVEKRRDMLLLETGEVKKSIDVLGKVFGVVYFSEVLEVKSDIKPIERAVLRISRKIKPEQTFALRVNRVDKKFPLTSKEVENKIGAKIRKKVDLKKPDKTIFVGIGKDKTYVYSEKIRGLGGLPFGVSGKVLCLISGGIDSPVASWMLMKRGCSAEFVYFYPYPFTSEKNRKRVIGLVKKLREYSPEKLILHIVPFGKIQEEVIKNCERRLTCVICRRLMYRLAEVLAKEINARALVTGENLAQVASQTLENLYSETDVLKMPIFRPLVGFDKVEIINLAKKIGTYDLSTEGVMCCTLTPKKPRTKSELEMVLEEEGKIKDLDNLVKSSIEKKESVLV